MLLVDVNQQVKAAQMLQGTKRTFESGAIGTGTRKEEIHTHTQHSILVSPCFLCCGGGSSALCDCDRVCGTVLIPLGQLTLHRCNTLYP